jgi:hypothetical protein
LSLEQWEILKKLMGDIDGELNGLEGMKSKKKVKK